MDQDGGGGVLLDLLAQPQNVDVDGAIGDGAVLSPTASSNCSRLKTTPGRLIRNSSSRNSVAVSDDGCRCRRTWRLVRIELKAAGFENARPAGPARGNGA